jgi:hypothetical protein
MRRDTTASTDFEHTVDPSTTIERCPLVARFDTRTINAKGVSRGDSVGNAVSIARRPSEVITGASVTLIRLG